MTSNSTNNVCIFLWQLELAVSDLMHDSKWDVGDQSSSLSINSVKIWNFAQILMPFLTETSLVFKRSYIVRDNESALLSQS